MIPLRKLPGAAALVATPLALAVGCSGGYMADDEDPSGTPGCAGVCSVDGGAGMDGGASPRDAGMQADAGAPPTVVMTIAEARRTPFDGRVRVKLEGVVIHTVESPDHGPRSDAGTPVRFWVVDPARPTQGLWVEKSPTDLPTDFVPQVGQYVDITGWMQAGAGDEQLEGYRARIANPRVFDNSLGRLEIRLIDTLPVPADNRAPPGFGAADGGWLRPNPELLGTRVYVPGPLVMTDPSPSAFPHVPALSNGSAFNGFEVSGGILVSSRNTSGPSPTDGGPARCDWQDLVRGDGGVVVFPNGIRGVWDTYTYVPCQDGGTEDLATCPKDPAGGRVPGTELPDGGFGNAFTHVLLPQDCDRDLAGVWDAGG
ncbi:hypothetical protein [Archangium lipolyticum]|uniref:hypothetical protein n=1 Tax=Archangium lipolyticum TaxID=2970465 RepID=UPI00214A7547|nr:hypothetical protein [Archangium lipolyticum]